MVTLSERLLYIGKGGLLVLKLLKILLTFSVNPYLHQLKGQGCALAMSIAVDTPYILKAVT